MQYSFTVQLEELLEPYLKDTNLGLPYWDWTKDSRVPDLWEGITSPVKEWNEKRDSDFGAFDESDIGDWRKNCRSPTTNIGENVLRINDLNVLSKERESLVRGTNDAMESVDFESFRRSLEVYTYCFRQSYLSLQYC